jgi:large subunit ribosomal protein L24
MHIKKNDNVVVVSGKDKGKKGKVMQVLPDERKVLVDGINVVKKHTRPKPPKVPQGGIMEKAMPVDASNVMLVCPQCSAVVRAARKESHRVCRKCKEIIP